MRYRCESVPNDVGIGDLFHRRPFDENSNATYLSGKPARYGVDGLPSPVPDGVTLVGTTSFARDNAGAMAMFLYANPRTEQIEELADPWDLHPVVDG